jgi:hypothetical protein
MNQRRCDGSGRLRNRCARINSRSARRSGAAPITYHLALRFFPSPSTYGPCFREPRTAVALASSTPPRSLPPEGYPLLLPASGQPGP